MKINKFTAVDFFEDLSSPYARRRFLWAIVILVLILLVLYWAILQFFDNGIWPNFAASVLEQMIGGLIVIFLFYAFYVYFLGVNTAQREISAVRKNDISETLGMLRTDTKEYYFWGRSGGYFRTEVIRELAAQAQKSKKFITVKVLLPDPNQPKMVEAYGEILKSLQEDAVGSQLLDNVLATVATCAWVAANNRFLKCEVYISNFLPAFRVDLSDHGAIITQDDPSKAAIFVGAASEFFDMYRGTILTETLIARKIELPIEKYKNFYIETARISLNQLEELGVAKELEPDAEKRVNALLDGKGHRY